METKTLRSLWMQRQKLFHVSKNSFWKQLFLLPVKQWHGAVAIRRSQRDSRWQQGNRKGLKVGTATITAKIGDVIATCEVTVDFATGLEEALANTEVFGRKGNIYVNRFSRYKWPLWTWSVRSSTMHVSVAMRRIPVNKRIYNCEINQMSENTKVN